MKIQELIAIYEPFATGDGVARIYAEHLSELFSVVDGERISPDYRAAIASEDARGAVTALAKYLRSRPRFTIPELSSVGEYDISLAEKTVRGEMREVSVDWSFPDGEIDFLFDPTALMPPVNPEWLWQFNRHKYWSNLSRAYVGTGDERYALTFRRQALKWIGQTYAPEVWNAVGSAWRTIECGIRLLGHWQVAYDGFIRSRSIEDEVLLLFVASMHRQSTHLVKHPTKGNWLMMEMNGAYTFSSLFPELCDSEANRRFAADRIVREIAGQILPDGFQNELSPDYQSVVISCAANFYNLATELGDSVPESFTELIRLAVDAMIRASTPAFTQPRTNDTFTIFTKTFVGRAQRIFGDLPEYRFVLSERAEGEPPRGDTASHLLPYAGFAVMRSDWGADASYMCFDVGPLGCAHIHQDMLNINLFKGSEELIYDDGGGQYDVSDAREYAVSGYGHNTLTVDGLAQRRSTPHKYLEPVSAGWVSCERFDYAAATYDGGFGKDEAPLVTHERRVRFEKPDVFCVSDLITSADGEAHDYEILFHLDTTRVLPLSGYENGVISDFGRRYEVAIIPLDDGDATPELLTVSASKEPFQGWFNGRNAENLHEAITVSRRVRGVKNYRFNTLLIPVERGGALPTVERDGERVRVTLGEAEYSFSLDEMNK